MEPDRNELGRPASLVSDGEIVDLAAYRSQCLLRDPRFREYLRCGIPFFRAKREVERMLGNDAEARCAEELRRRSVGLLAQLGSPID